MAYFERESIFAMPADDDAQSMLSSQYRPSASLPPLSHTTFPPDQSSGAAASMAQPGDILYGGIPGSPEASDQSSRFCPTASYRAPTGDSLHPTVPGITAKDHCLNIFQGNHPNGFIRTHFEGWIIGVGVRPTGPSFALDVGLVAPRAKPILFAATLSADGSDVICNTLQEIYELRTLAMTENDYERLAQAIRNAAVRHPSVQEAEASPPAAAQAEVATEIDPPADSHEMARLYRQMQQDAEKLRERGVETAG